MAPDLHRRRHLFIFDSEWFVGEVELADLLDHRELTVDAVDRGADRGAELLMFAEQLHILGQSLGLGPFGRPFGVGYEDADEMRALVAIDHRLQDFGLERQHALDTLRRWEG